MWFPSILAVAALTLAGGQALTSNTLSSGNHSMAGQAHHGHAKGHWSSPDHSGPGKMIGRFFSPQGTPLMEVRADVLAPLPGESVGVLHGMVVTVGGPNEVLVGQLHGHWRPGAGHGGEFKAQILRQLAPG